MNFYIAFPFIPLYSFSPFEIESVLASQGGILFRIKKICTRDSSIVYS